MTRRVLSAALGALSRAAAFAVATALLAACSPGADYPSVLDKPTPRADTMSPEQVKQATDALISDRDHLSAEVSAAPSDTAPSSTGSTGSTGSVAAQPVSATGSTRTAGAAAKP